jgi:hypothetical protein
VIGSAELGFENFAAPMSLKYSTTDNNQLMNYDKSERNSQHVTEQGNL